MAVLTQVAENVLQAPSNVTSSLDTITLALPRVQASNGAQNGGSNGNGHTVEISYLPEGYEDYLRTIVDTLITEDDTPVDNLFSEKQQRLLTEPLFASWAGPGEGRPFLATANVGMYYHLHGAPLVHDVLLSIDVHVPDELWAKNHRCYMVWEYGKSPDIVIEVVSNKVGEEDDPKGKLRKYAMANVPYYVIFDSLQLLSQDILRVYERNSQNSYSLSNSTWFEKVGLGLTLWEGEYEGAHAIWLRWHDANQALIQTGAERANAEADRANAEADRANAEADRANAEADRANAEADARRIAEQRIAELEAKLAAITGGITA